MKIFASQEFVIYKNSRDIKIFVSEESEPNVSWCH
jgi:hypothetical protein